ncbi:MAG: hypothetical protein R3B47_07595 [Bacteroidia bacterium]
MFKDQSKTSKVIFILSLLTAAYWILAQYVDVYRYSIIGVIFEMAWLIMIAGLFVLPLVSLVLLIKEKFSLKSLYLYALLLLLVAGLVMFLKN